MLKMRDREDLLRKAWQKGVLTLRFSACYLAMMEPIIQAIVDQDSHGIISTAPIEWELFEYKTPDEFMKEFQKWDKPDHVRVHIEHISTKHPLTHKPYDYESTVREIIDLGFPSLMIDGSYEENFETNIEVTKKVVELCHKNNVLVEAEAGEILGYDQKLPYQTIFEKRMGFTTPQQAERMVNETNCDWLAVAVGTIHGALKGAAALEEKQQSRLDIELIEQISNVVDVPLIVHGGTSINKDDIKMAVSKGLAKVCVGHDIRSRFQKVMQGKNSVLAAKQAVYDRVSWLIREYYGIAGSSKIVNS